MHYCLNLKLWDDKVKSALCGPYFLRTKKMSLPYKPLSNTILNYIQLEDSTVQSYVIQQPIPLSIGKQLRSLFPDNCKECGGSDLRIQHEKGMYICAECGIYNAEVTENEYIVRPYRCRKRITPRLHEPCYFKRVSHFRYWLRRLQGQEYAVLPDHIVTIVIQELRRYPFTEDDLYYHIKAAMKRLGYQRYYDNIIQIICRFYGRPFVSFTKVHERELIKMFQNLQQCYHSHGRINMIFYPYLIKKFCEIQGWWDVAQSIPMLKSQSKIREQDRIWKELCLVLGYPFYVTI